MYKRKTYNVKRSLSDWNSKTFEILIKLQTLFTEKLYTYLAGKKFNNLAYVRNN